MCKDLVSLNTQDVSKAIPVTNTKIISEKLGIQHRYIKKHLKDQEKYFLRFGLLVACATESTGGRPEEIIELNEEQSMFLMTLLKNTEEVVEFKFNLVKAFNFMKRISFPCIIYTTVLIIPLILKTILSKLTFG